MTRMRKIIRAGISPAVVLGAVWLMLTTTIAFGQEQDAFPINVYPCPETDVAPVLDGKLDDAVWQKASLVSAFLNYDTDKLAKVQTSFRVLWDNQNLYFGIHCDEPLMAKFSPVLFARDELALFSNETIELFVDPDHSNDLYYQLAMNAAGSLYDSRRMDSLWNSDTVVKAYCSSNFWSLEIALPFKSLDTAPKPGKVIGFNICRDRNIGEKEWTNWSRTKGGFHDPIRFAHLVLSGTPEQIGKLSDELRKGERTGPIIVYSAEGFSQKTYSQLAVTTLAGLDKLLADLEAERGREPDQAAADELGLRLATYHQQVAAMRAQSQGTLDAATWTRLDVEMQQTIGLLSKVVWEARLQALLKAL